ncbi:MAG: hypothetical protein HZC48_12440 [Nitrospirae bacterium]|nr:hypothetical protein [Nitrospirota bacterium]
MKRTKGVLFYFFLMLFAVSAGLILSDIKANALSDSDEIGEFKSIKGEAKLIRSGKTIVVKEGESFKLQDIAVTETNAEALVILKDESLIVLGGPPKSKLSLKEYSLSNKDGGKSVLALPYGEMRAITCQDRFDIETALSKVYAFGSLDFAIWESTVDGKPASCVGVLKGGVVEVKNIDVSIKETVRIPKGEMSCVTAGEVPSDPVTISDEILKALIAKGNRAHIDHACQPCLECERLNPEGVCVPDNLKPCDDGDSCTIDDRCLGGKCKGKKDPSSVDPNCS